ncbi:MAG: rod shape-determining protein MreB [Firmicutes bacterium]|nr:rod shape-determining protein MreB [Bacillota bacterium]
MFKGSDIGIDLGTATVLVFVKGKGVVINEPAVVAVDTNTRSVLAIGEEARRMIGRTPGNIVATRPLREGVIADFDMTQKMLEYFILRALGKRRLVRPRIMVCVPSGVTPVEWRAVRDAAERAGGMNITVIEEPVAAALGAGIDITKPEGSLVVDIGGGTTDVAILSLGGIVLADSVRVGGDRFDDALIRYMKQQYNLLIGERTAEEMKLRIGVAYPGVRNETMDVRGRDLLSGLPKTITVSSMETLEAFSEPLNAIVALLRSVLEHCPPELAADIMDKGIILTGGGALVCGLDKLLAEITQVPVLLAEDPITCVARGTGRALEILDQLKGMTIFDEPRRESSRHR